MARIQSRPKKKLPEKALLSGQSESQKLLSQAGCTKRRGFLPADKAIFRSNPGRIARESNAVCEQKDRPGGVQ